MDITSICVCYHSSGGFQDRELDGQFHSKSLPVLSVVQSVRGSYRLSLGDAPAVETGEMGVFVAPRHIEQHITHMDDATGIMEAQWVFLDVEIDRQYKLDDLYTFPPLLPACYQAEIFELIRTVRTEPTFIKRLPALHRLVEILLENATPKPRIHEDLAYLINYVEAHHMSPITSEELMRILHCSRSSLYRLFQEAFGMSPVHYINHIRIQHAQLLLSTTDMSISEIAVAVGIPDVNYFARLFRRTTGQTGRAYRETAARK